MPCLLSRNELATQWRGHSSEKAHMNYREDKRALRRIEHTATGLVFSERRFTHRSKPLRLNKEVLFDGQLRACTLGWMPVKKCWSINVSHQWGWRTHIKPIARVKQLKEVWEIVINMVPTK